jgi:HSP20 family protein
MSITRWDPVRDFVSLREAMDRLFEDSFIRPGAAWSGDGMGTAFAIDLYETPDAFVLKAPLPGIKPDEIDINATGDGVVIRGELKPDTQVKPEAWLRQERRYGKFQRGFTLPTQIDPNKVDATFEHGVLTLTLPKAETVKAKQIKVKGSETAIEGRAR